MLSILLGLVAIYLVRRWLWCIAPQYNAPDVDYDTDDTDADVSDHDDSSEDEGQADSVVGNVQMDDDD